MGNGRTDPNTLGHHIIPAITFKHLGLAADPSWEPGVFGFAPYLDTETGGNAVHLQWEMPASGLPGLTAIEIRRGGTLLQTLPSTSLGYTEFPAPAAETTSVMK